MRRTDESIHTRAYRQRRPVHRPELAERVAVRTRGFHPASGHVARVVNRVGHHSDVAEALIAAPVRDHGQIAPEYRDHGEMVTPEDPLTTPSP